MFASWFRRLRNARDYPAQHRDDPTPPIAQVGPATRYLSRTGAYADANVHRQWPTVRASAPVTNQRPWPVQPPH